MPIVLTILDSFMSTDEIKTNYSAVYNSLSSAAAETKTYLSSTPKLKMIPDMVSFSQYKTLLFLSPTYLLKFWNDTSLYRVLGFGYDGVEYSRLNDSVQLSFIDLRKTGARLTLQAGDGPRMIIDSNTLCDDFYRYINTYVDTSYDINSWPDEEKLTFDPHYQTDGLFFAVGFLTDTTDPLNSPLIMPVFTRHDRQLWYIEFPPLDMRGIFRDMKSNRESYRRSFGCLP